MTGHDQIDDRREQWPLLRLVACRMPVCIITCTWCMSIKQASAVCRKCFMFHVDRDRLRRSSCMCAIMPAIYRKCFDCKQTASHGLAPAAAVACYTSLPTPSKSKRSAFHLIKKQRVTVHIRNLRGEMPFFPLGYIQNRPFKKVNFLTVKVPENLHTTSSSPINKIYVKKIGGLRSKIRTSEPP